MDDKRSQKRYSPAFSIIISHPANEQIQGKIINMSDSGVLAKVPSPQRFHTTMLVDAKIHGENCDDFSYPVEMEVMRIERDSIALRFTEPLVGNWWQDDDWEQESLDLWMANAVSASSIRPDSNCTTPVAGQHT